MFGLSTIAANIGWVPSVGCFAGPGLLSASAIGCGAGFGRALSLCFGQLTRWLSCAVTPALQLREWVAVERDQSRQQKAESVRVFRRALFCPLSRLRERARVRVCAGRQWCFANPHPSPLPKGGGVNSKNSQALESAGVHVQRRQHVFADCLRGASFMFAWDADQEQIELLAREIRELALAGDLPH